MTTELVIFIVFIGLIMLMLYLIIHEFWPYTKTKEDLEYEERQEYYKKYRNICEYCGQKHEDLEQYCKHCGAETYPSIFFDWEKDHLK